MKNLAVVSVFVSMSLILFVIESAIPFPILPPGAKFGFANLITLVSLEILGTRSAFLILSLRIFLSSIFFGGGIIFLYSITAGFFSFTAMIFLRKHFSIVGISSAGGFCHNTAQIFIAMILMDSISIWNYLPILGTCGILTGILNGILAVEIVSKLKIIITDFD